MPQLYRNGSEKSAFQMMGEYPEGMKSSEETLAWILDSIRHAYERPTLYGNTKRGLSSLLWAYHSIWAFMTGSEAAFRNACIESLGGTNNDAHIIGESDQVIGFADFDPIIQQWKWIDERLGIELPSPKDDQS
jgi:hypothetical protein